MDNNFYDVNGVEAGICVDIGQENTSGFYGTVVEINSIGFIKSGRVRLIKGFGTGS